MNLSGNFGLPRIRIGHEVAGARFEVTGSPLHSHLDLSGNRESTRLELELRSVAASVNESTPESIAPKWSSVGHA